MSLIVKADVKTFMKIATLDLTWDTLIDSLIPQVEAYVDKVTNRVLAGAEHVDYYDGDDSDALILEKYPVKSVTSIYIDPDRAYGADTLIASSSYSVYTKEGTIRFDVGISLLYGFKAVKVTYKAGYDADGTTYTQIPADLKLAIVKYVTAEVMLDQMKINVIRSADGEVLEDRPSRYKKEAEKVFALYRRRVM
jgi:uncharacterized phiE125 gp8 family phage protein